MNTAAGLEAYIDSGEDLNIGDLANVPGSDFLTEYGVEELFISCNEDVVVPYDTHLCIEDPDIPNV